MLIVLSAFVPKAFAAKDFNIKNNSQSFVYVNGTSGNVGIGSVTAGQLLDVQGTARMLGFALTGNGAANGNVLVGNSVGVGTWMPASTLATLVGSNYWLLNGGAGNVGINTINAVGIGTSFVGGTGEAALSVMNGNVGIGTWAASKLFQVGSNANAVTIDNTGLLTVSNNGVVIADGSTFSGGNTYFYTGSTSSDWEQGNGGAGVIGIEVEYNTATATNVGINTNVPTGALEIEGGNVGIGTTKTSTAGLTIMNGNVGIGTWIPALMLDVNGTSRMTGFVLTGNGAANGNVLVGNSVGVGTWMPASTLATTASGSNYWLLNGGAGNVGINTIYAVGIGTSFVGGTGEASLSVMNGNVGIGTWVPGHALEVNGNIGLLGQGIYSIFGAYEYQWNNGNNIVENSPVNNAETIYTGSSSNIAAMTWGATGNVGIGSLTPGQALDVTGTARMTGFVLSGNGAVSGNVMVTNGVGVGTWMPASTLATAASSSNYWLLNGGAGNVGINTINAVGIGTSFVGGTGEAALSVMNGNVGIGTWVPTALFQVGTPSAGMQEFSNGLLSVTGTVETGGNVISENDTPFDIYNNAGSGSYTYLAGGGGTNSYLTLSSVNNVNSTYGSTDYINFEVGNSLNTATLEAMRMISGGNIGIGSITPGQKLDVQGTIRTTGFTLTGNGAANGNVLVGNSVGVGTWMPASTLATAASGTNYWLLNGGAGNVGINTIYAVGIGTSFVGGTGGEASFAVMNGNVGIGTWVPGGLFQVNTGDGPFVISSNGNTTTSGGLTTGAAISAVNLTNFGIYNNTEGAGADTLIYGGGSASSSLSLYSTYIVDSYGTSDYINFFISNTAGNASQEAMRIINGGNVGIGSISPGQLLDVQGTIRMKGLTLTGNGAANGNVLVGNSVGVGTWMPASTLAAGSNYWLLNGGAGNIGINTINAVGIGTSFVGGTGEAAFAVTNGNVGIGTWVPANIFQIGNGTTPALSVDQGGDVTTGGDITIGNFNNLYIDAGSVVETATGGGSIQFGGGPAYLNLQTGANSAIYIDANSNVGIGTKTTVGGLSVMNGNVGIGTWIPALILDVNGTARMKGFTLTGNGAANGDILVGNSVGVGTWMATSTLTAGLLNSATVNQVAYYSGVTALSGNSKFVFIPVSGNVGIGTIGPTSVLQVVGNVGIGTTTAASTPYTLNINNIAVFNGEYNNGSPTSPITINWAKGNKQAVTLTATGMTIDFTNPSVGVGMFQLKLIQGVASSTVTTWTPSSGNIYWAGGSAPTLTTTVNYLDIVSCYYDGTNYYCSATLDFQ